MHGWFAGLATAARLEVRHALRHPSILVICALLPVFWCLLMAVTFGTGIMTKLPVGLVNEDAGPLARETVMVLDAVPTMRLESYATASEAEAALRRGETYATIVFPQHFTRDSLNGRGATIELLINKSYYSVSTFLEVDIKSALAAAQKSAGAERMTAARGGSFAANSRSLRVQAPEVDFIGNTAFNFNAYLLPTLIPGLLSIAAGVTFAGVLIREWRDGGAAELLEAVGGRAGAAVLGKLLPWVFWYILTALCWMVGFTGWLGWPPAGSLVFWAVGSVLFITAMAGITLMICAYSLTWVIAVSGVMCMFAPSFPFTGFSYPFEAMTPGVVFWGHLLPVTHYLALQGECWVLSSPVQTMMEPLRTMALLTIVPLAAGLPVMAHRLRKAARVERKAADLLKAARETGELPPPKEGGRG